MDLLWLAVVFCICVLAGKFAVGYFGHSGFTDLLSNQWADSAGIRISCKPDGATDDCHVGTFRTAGHCPSDQKNLIKQDDEEEAA